MSSSPIPEYADGLSWGYGLQSTSVLEEESEQAQGLVAKAARELRDAGFQVETAIEVGDAKAVILDAAAKWPADLIVLGSHGRKGLERFLMGSVSEAVARHAHCSVQIVCEKPSAAPERIARWRFQILCPSLRHRAIQAALGLICPLPLPSWRASS